MTDGETLIDHLSRALIRNVRLKKRRIRLDSFKPELPETYAESDGEKHSVYGFLVRLMISRYLQQIHHRCGLSTVSKKELIVPTILDVTRNDVNTMFYNK